MKNSLKNVIKKSFSLNTKKLIGEPLKVLKKINIENLTKITSKSLAGKYKSFKEKIKQKEKNRIELIKREEIKELKKEKLDQEIQKDITVAEIRAASYGSGVDINENKQNDFQDAMQDIRKRDEYREQMNFKKEQASVDNSNVKSKMNLEREKLNTQREIANKNLAIARENKNKYDVKAPKNDKKK